jgi:hypothetical protein
MPTIVKVSAYTGILLWFVMFAIFGINMIIDLPPARNPADAQFDKVALPISLVLSFGGIAVSVGMLYARVWAYHVFVTSLGLVAATLGVVAVLGMGPSLGTAGVGVFCTLAMLLRHVLVGTQVRTFFGLAPIDRNLLLVPGWLNAGMGVACLSLLFWPQPTPMFGTWLERWHELILNFAFGVGYLALGWGMLRAYRWIWPIAIVLALGSLLCSAGMAWDPNPQERLGPEEAMTHQSVLKGTVVVMAWSWWSLRRIWRYRREIVSNQGG